MYLRRALRRTIPPLFLWANNLHRRLLGVLFAAMGPNAAYSVSGFLARILYRLTTPLRVRSERQCRLALGNEVSDERIAHVAEHSFVHRIWNLTDLILADRLLHAGTYPKYCVGLPEPHLSRALDIRRRGQAAIFLSAYYGPFDLLPVFLGFQGVQAGVVYRVHANQEFDEYRRRIRARSGCEMIPVERALRRLPEILESGGTVAIIADHHAERRGIPVTFLGIPTMALRTVGILACRYGAEVAVAGIRRTPRAFRFEVDVQDTIKPPDWAKEEDPVRYITERYLRALERIVLRDPTQYVWGQPRWGEELARRLTEAGEPNMIND